MHTNDDTASRTATIARLNDNARLGLDRRARVQFTSNCLETFRPTPETHVAFVRSEEHTSELQSLMRNSYAVFCLKKKNQTQLTHKHLTTTHTHTPIRFSTQ